jgi:hypothetical protein
MTPKERLREDLLTDCAEALQVKTRECEDLKLDNAFLILQVRILLCRLKKLTGSEHAR